MGGHGGAGAAGWALVLVLGAGPPSEYSIIE
jgi:hypothetical protein